MFFAYFSSFIFIDYFMNYFMKLQGLGQAFDRLQPFALCILLSHSALRAGFMSAYGPASSFILWLKLQTSCDAF